MSAPVVVAALLAAAVVLATRSGRSPSPHGRAPLVRRALARVRRPADEVGGAADDVPLLLELVAAAVTAGLPPGRALEQALDALPVDAPDQLRRVCAQLACGAEPEAAWAGVDERWRPLAEPLLLSLATGAPAAVLLVSAASVCRTERRRAAEEAAARLGSLLVLPLGLCTLPSFLLLGVVPVVLTLAGDLVGS